jgi:hypothetical protein
MQILFLLAIAAYFYLSFILTRRVLPAAGAWRIIALSSPLFLALVLVTVGTVGRFTHNFDMGVWVGSALCLGLALFLQFFRRSPRIPLDFRLKLTRSDLPLLAVFLFLSFLIVAVSVKYSIYDEQRLQGHQVVVEMILRGKFPPVYTAFPEVPYRYHYGFNLLSALFSKALGLPGYWGIDVAAIFSWLSLFALLLVFLLSLGIPRSALALGILFLTLSGGLSWWLLRDHPETYDMVYQVPQWQQMYVYYRGIHPHFMMYFFQHPMGLGAVLFIGALQYFKIWADEKRRSVLWLGAVLLGALSLAQVMLFVTCLAALGLVFFFRFFSKEISWQANLRDGLGVLAISLLLAFAMGGFFQTAAGLENQSILFSWPPSYLRYEYYGSKFLLGWKETLIWYLSGFGLLFLLIPYAFYRAFRQRSFIIVFLLSFCILCFLIPKFFRYSFSWDIIKWYFGFEFSARLLVIWAYLPWIVKKPWLTLPAWLLVLFGAVTPFNFLSDLTFKKSFTRAEGRIAYYKQPEPGGVYQSFIDDLKRCSECYGTVWSSPGSSDWLAVQTGYPMVEFDRVTAMMPVSRDKINRRKNDLKRLNTDPNMDLLRSLGIRWAIFTCRDFRNLPEKVQNFLGSLTLHPGVEDRSAINQGGQCLFVYHLK